MGAFQPTPRGGVDAFVVPGPACDALLRDIGREATVERDLSLLAVVGGAMGEGRSTGEATPSVVERAPSVIERAPSIIERSLGALASADVRPRASFLGEERASQLFIVREADLEPGVRALHAELFERAHARLP